MNEFCKTGCAIAAGTALRAVVVAQASSLWLSSRHPCLLKTVFAGQGCPADSHRLEACATR